jgi:hypothetical protein
MERGGDEVKLETYYRDTGVDIWKKQKRWNRGWSICSGG